MNLNDQVISLELAKRLKKLGVIQESQFYWEFCPDAGGFLPKAKFIISYIGSHDIITGEFTDCHRLRDQENYSAFTVAELGEILSSFKSWQEWLCQVSTMFEDTKEADARAKMLIYLLENKLMENK